MQKRLVLLSVTAVATIGGGAVAVAWTSGEAPPVVTAGGAPASPAWSATLPGGTTTEPPDALPSDEVPADDVAADEMTADEMTADEMTSDDTEGDAAQGDEMHTDAMHTDAMHGDEMHGDKTHDDETHDNEMHGGAMSGSGSVTEQLHGHHEGHNVPLAQRTAEATPEERAAAAAFLAETTAAIAPYRELDAAVAAGFRPEPGVAATGATSVHYRQIPNRRDDRQLDPSAPEGLVYHRDLNGAYHLLGAVFTVHGGEPAPTPGGPIFAWHTHDERLCDSFYVPPGECTDAFRMLHVWTTTDVVIRDPWINPFAKAVDWEASAKAGLLNDWNDKTRASLDELFAKAASPA